MGERSQGEVSMGRAGWAFVPLFCGYTGICASPAFSVDGDEDSETLMCPKPCRFIKKGHAHVRFPDFSENEVVGGKATQRSAVCCSRGGSISVVDLAPGRQL